MTLRVGVGLASYCLSGTSRHFAATQHVCRFQSEADMNRQVRAATSVANDPNATSARHSTRQFPCAKEGWQCPVLGEAMRRREVITLLSGAAAVGRS